MIKLTQNGTINKGPLGSNTAPLYLNPECIESLAANQNYGTIAPNVCKTVIRMKTGAIHYVDESADEINGLCNAHRIGLLEEARMRK